MTWREKSREVLMQLRPSVEMATIGEARRIVFDAYPFGQRRYTPYKIWCQEVKKCFPWLRPNLRDERPSEKPWVVA